MTDQHPDHNVWEETAEMQDANVRGGRWKESGANMQMVTFYSRMLRVLRESHMWVYFEPYATVNVDAYDYKGVSGYSAEIHDWGCSFGNGTALIQAAFPLCRVIGYDYSKECLRQARYRWPELQFRQGDIREASDPATIIFTSHTIEHTEDPAKVVQNLRSLCDWLVVVVPPINAEQDGGHTGAVLTEEWISELHPRPLLFEQYITVRFDKGRDYYAEGNVLMLLQGT